MSDETKKPKNKKKVNLAKIQLIGFWAIVILSATFWFGTFIGTQATLNSQANEAQVKTQAVEAYKATLKAE
jgi:flagellar basal body-associated protein FliL